MDPIDYGPLRITLRRYGPTVHLTLAGDLDHEAEAALAGVREAALADEVVVIACDLHHVHFMDLSGLRCLLDLREAASELGIAVLAYNWRPQPLRLLHLLAGIQPGEDTGLRVLHGILREHTEAQLVRGIDTARETSALVASGRRRPAGDQYDPGPPPAAR